MLVELPDWLKVLLDLMTKYRRKTSICLLNSYRSPGGVLVTEGDGATPFTYWLYQSR